MFFLFAYKPENTVEWLRFIFLFYFKFLLWRKEIVGKIKKRVCELIFCKYCEFPTQPDVRCSRQSWRFWYVCSAIREMSRFSGYFLKCLLRTEICATNSLSCLWQQIQKSPCLLWQSHAFLGWKASINCQIFNFIDAIQACYLFPS